jgi:hypothetical protein
MAPDRPGPTGGKVVDDGREPKGESLTRSAPPPRRHAPSEKAEMNRDEQQWDNEGGHMSSTSGRVKHVRGADLPYLVVLAHPDGEASERAFATMREAEAFIKRNTPVPGGALSDLYDRPAGES